MNLKQGWHLLKEAASSWSDDRAPSMGAAISYYSMFSIAPLLVIVISVAGLFFGTDAVQGAVFAQIQSLMGEEAANAIGEMLKNANQPETGGIAAIVSVFVLLFGASTVLAEMQSALDRIWRVPEQAKESGLWTWIRSRLLTFGMVLALAFLMLISLVMSAALSALGKWWGPLLGGWEGLAHVLDLSVSFGLLTVVFALIYKFMPRAHIRWHDVLIGAAVTAALFTIGKWLIGLYLGKSDVASGFGAFGSLALLMVWVYYSAQIFLFGAEFTWVYAHEFGSRRGEPRPASMEALEDAAATGGKTPAPTQPVVAPPPVIAPQPAMASTLAEPPASSIARHPQIAFTAALLAGAAVRIGLSLWRNRGPGLHARTVPSRGR
jgi:membrane protein